MYDVTYICDTWAKLAEHLIEEARHGKFTVQHIKLRPELKGQPWEVRITRP